MSFLGLFFETKESFSNIKFIHQNNTSPQVHNSKTTEIVIKIHKLDKQSNRNINHIKTIIDIDCCQAQLKLANLTKPNWAELAFIPIPPATRPDPTRPDPTRPHRISFFKQARELIFGMEPVFCITKRNIVEKNWIHVMSSSKF